MRGGQPADELWELVSRAALNRELGEDVVSVCMSGYLHSAPHRVIAVINKNYLDSEQVKEQRSII